MMQIQLNVNILQLILKWPRCGNETVR